MKHIQHCFSPCWLENALSVLIYIYIYTCLIARIHRANSSCCFIHIYILYEWIMQTCNVHVSACCCCCCCHVHTSIMLGLVTGRRTHRGGDKQTFVIVGKKKVQHVSSSSRYVHVQRPFACTMHHASLWIKKRMRNTKKLAANISINHSYEIGYLMLFCICRKYSAR